MPGRKPPKLEPRNWRERMAGLRYVPPLLAMVWRTHRGYTATVVTLRLLRAAVPVATLWLGKLILDTGVRLAATRESTAFGGDGLGYGAANLRVVVRRGAAADTVVVSRLGRVR